MWKITDPSKENVPTRKNGRLDLLNQEGPQLTQLKALEEPKKLWFLKTNLAPKNDGCQQESPFLRGLYFRCKILVSGSNLCSSPRFNSSGSSATQSIFWALDVMNPHRRRSGRSWSSSGAKMLRKLPPWKFNMGRPRASKGSRIRLPITRIFRGRAVQLPGV